MKIPLSKADRASYLANVLSIAKADDAVDRREALAVRAIAERIGADQHDLLAAKKLLGDGNYGLRFLPHPSHRMANIEDMVMVALADGRTVDEETGPIEKLAGVLKFSQVDMDMVVQRAETALKRVLGPDAGDGSASRPPFDTPAPDEPATAAPRLPRTPPPPPPVTQMPPEPPPPPHAGTLLEPGHVRMPSTGRPHRPALPTLGRRAPQPDAAPVPVQPVESRLQRCIRTHDASEAPRAYCFGAGAAARNCWGCRLADMDWKPGADWLTRGAFRDDRTFVFDKDAIRELLEVRLAKASACPHLKLDYVKEAVALFPARAGTLGRWRHRTVPVGTPGAQPVTIKQHIHGVGVTLHKLANGVDPVGEREALKLIRRASKLARTTPPEPDALA